jgi:hypothetical protein
MCLFNPGKHLTACCHHYQLTSTVVNYHTFHQYCLSWSSLLSLSSSLSCKLITTGSKVHHVIVLAEPIPDGEKWAKLVMPCLSAAHVGKSVIRIHAASHWSFITMYILSYLICSSMFMTGYDEQLKGESCTSVTIIMAQLNLNGHAVQVACHTSQLLARTVDYMDH